MSPTIFSILSILILSFWAQALPTLPPPSALFPYRTNFFNVLRLKSRLVLNPNVRNISVLIRPNETLTYAPPPPTFSQSNDELESETEPFSGPPHRLHQAEPVLPNKCGVQQAGHADRNSRIVGGELVGLGEFPWMVSMSPYMYFELSFQKRPLLSRKLNFSECFVFALKGVACVDEFYVKKYFDNYCYFIIIRHRYCFEVVITVAQ